MLYLFGVSPAVCASFLGGRKVAGLEELRRGTWYAPHATSLRMSDLGYRNKNQAALQVSVNSLDHYVRDLTHAITTPHPDYERIGVKVDGEYRQLNANVLQIENEYYSFIRPKRVTLTGERPTKALRRGGVQYVEMRSLDVSAFDPVGVNQNKLRFLEAFAAFCVLRESQPIEPAEQSELDGNHAIVAKEGRRPGLRLRQDGRDVEPARLGARDRRRDARHLRAARRQRSPAPVLHGARSPGGQDHRSRADAGGADCWRNSHATTSRFSSWGCACPSCTGPISSSCIRRTNRGSSSSPRRLTHR